MGSHTLAFTPGAGGGGDIVTREQLGDFELVLEWRISPGGNSGVFYRGLESTDYIFETAAEMQVLDNAGHADGRSPSRRPAQTSASTLPHAT